MTTLLNPPTSRRSLLRSDGRVVSWVPILLGLLIAVGPFSTDLYLPAFPAIEHDLGTAPGSVQITLSAWFAGLAIGQLSQGPLTDRFGRRAPLLIGTLIYTLASIGCATATSLWSLSIFRVLAALGGSASMVIPRAIVRDLVTGPDAARLMSRLMLVMGVVPIAAPSLGGALMAFASWRDLFWICTAYGVISLVASWAMLPDTLPVARRIGLAPIGMLERFIRIGAERTFITNSLATAFGSFVMFSYLSAGPMTFETVLGLSPRDYGLAFGLNALGYIGITQINAALVHRHGLRRLLVAGCVICLTGACGLVALAAFADRHPPVALVMGLCFLCVGSLGLVFSNAATAAMRPHPHQAGSASALMGMVQYSLGALAGALMAALSRPALWPLASTLLLGAVTMAICVRMAPREGTGPGGVEPHRHARDMVSDPFRRRTMQYRRLGQSGLSVPPFALGTGTFGGKGEFFKVWGSTEAKEATRLVDVCLDHGVNLFDSADIYSSGSAEEVLGAAITGRRDKVLISTKATFRFSDAPNDVGSSRQHLIRAVEGSLKRLGTDYIDIFQLHGFDAQTPIAETLSTLDDLVRAGKIRYVGVSNFSGWHLAKSLAYAERFNLPRYVANQTYYSLIGRDYEHELMPLGLDQGLGAIVWSPLGWGRLTGKVRRGQKLAEGSRLAQGGEAGGPEVDIEFVYKVVDAIDEIAKETGKTVPQIALNWLLQRPTVASVIIGARNEDQLTQNLGALGWDLTADQVARLDAASARPKPYPYWHQAGFAERNPSPV